jgi:hypothetical protein
MLTRWLPEDEENKLPPNASHQCGVGAFVMNERREVLVVQEKNGPLRGKDVWKMPTGLVQVRRFGLRMERGRGVACTHSMTCPMLKVKGACLRSGNCILGEVNGRCMQLCLGYHALCHAS